MSKEYTPLLTLTVVAAADILGNRFVNSAGHYPTAAHKGLGVNLFDDLSGNALSVIASGTAIGTAGAAIAQDVEVEIGTNGKVVTLAAGVAVGLAMELAGADGDLLLIKVY